MTSEKLYALLKHLDALDSKTNLQTALEGVRDNLNSLVSAPAQPHHQQNLASALTTLNTASEALRGAITPSQAAAIKQMGGDDFFEPSIAGTVRGWVQANAMTPSVARDAVRDFAARRDGFLDTIRNTYQNLEKLGVKESGLAPGGADVAFLIPRPIFDNELGSFAKEIAFINRMMQHLSEA